METQVCTKCEIEKELIQYRIRTRKHNGHKYFNRQCKKCEQDYNKQWLKDNPEIAKKRNGQWAKKYPEKRKNYMDRYYKNHQDKFLEYRKSCKERGIKKISDRKSYQKNKNKRCAYNKRHSEILSDRYIINLLIKKSGISRGSIKCIPQLIIAKREHMKLKRTIKQKQNGTK